MQYSYSLGQIYESSSIGYPSSNGTNGKVNNSYPTYPNILDPAIEYTFGKGSYLVRCTLSGGPSCSINVKLRDNSRKYYQFIKKINYNGSGESFDIIVNAMNNFDVLVFEIERSSSSNYEVKIDTATIYKIDNNEKLSNSILKRISLHAEPNSVFIINNEEIKIGPTGVFDFNNDTVLINFFACVKAEKGYTLDYIEEKEVKQ